MTTPTPALHGGGTPEDCCTIRIEAQAVADQAIWLLTSALRHFGDDPVVAELEREIPAAIVAADRWTSANNLIARVLNADRTTIDGCEVVVIGADAFLPIAAVFEVLRQTLAPESATRAAGDAKPGLR